MIWRYLNEECGIKVAHSTVKVYVSGHRSAGLHTEPETTKVAAESPGLSNASGRYQARPPADADAADSVPSMDGVARSVQESDRPGEPRTLSGTGVRETVRGDHAKPNAASGQGAFSSEHDRKNMTITEQPDGGGASRTFRKIHFDSLDPAFEAETRAIRWPVSGKK